MSAPAQATLASTLYETDLRGQEVDRRLKTGFKDIDETLRGGFDFGRVCCISGDEGTGKTTVGFSLAASIRLLQIVQLISAGVHERRDGTYSVFSRGQCRGH